MVECHQWWHINVQHGQRNRLNRIPTAHQRRFVSLYIFNGYLPVLIAINLCCSFVWHCCTNCIWFADRWRSITKERWISLEFQRIILRRPMILSVMLVQNMEMSAFALIESQMFHPDRMDACIVGQLIWPLAKVSWISLLNIQQNEHLRWTCNHRNKSMNDFSLFCIKKKSSTQLVINVSMSASASTLKW